MSPIDPHGAPTRRQLLGSALALPFALEGRWRPAGAQEAPPREPPADALEAFYARWMARARALIAEPTPDEERFVYELAADVASRAPSFFPSRAETVYSGEGLRTGPIGRDDVFQLVELELDPGAVVAPHNHPVYCFVTLCLAGEARVRHFEPEPGAPSPAAVEQDFVVREVQDVLLRPGRVSTLTRSRANVHALVAGPEGARLMDFGVRFPPPPGGPPAFSVLEVDPDPIDAARETHPARWIGNPYAKGFQRRKKE